MRVVVYGSGGYDPSVIGGNVVEEYEADDPVSEDVAVMVDPQAMNDARAAVASATTVAALRKATLAALDLLNPST